MKITTTLACIAALTAPAALSAYTVDFSSFEIGQSFTSPSNLPGEEGPLRFIGNAPSGASYSAAITTNTLAAGGRSLRLSTTGSNGQPFSYIKDTQATTFGNEAIYRQVTFDLPNTGQGAIYIALVSGASSNHDGQFSLNTFQETSGQLAENPAMIAGFLLANNGAVNARRLTGEGADGSQQSYNPNTGQWQDDGVSFAPSLNAETVYTAAFSYNPDDQSITMSFINATSNVVLATAVTYLDDANSGVDVESFRLIVGDPFNNSTFNREINIHSITSIPEPSEYAMMAGLLFLGLAMCRRHFKRD